MILTNKYSLESNKCLRVFFENILSKLIQADAGPCAGDNFILANDSTENKSLGSQFEFNQSRVLNTQILSNQRAGYFVQLKQVAGSPDTPIRALKDY